MKVELAKVFPESDVRGFAASDLMRGTAFGVAVPDVDTVVCLQPRVLQSVMVYSSRRRSSTGGEDCSKFKKTALRMRTDQLISGGFKFRRSAFRGREPKVTLLAPAELGFHDESIPIDLSINSTTPLHNAWLLTECGRLDPRAQALALLVRRWAKDRGVCLAAKGHISPYYTHGH